MAHEEYDKEVAARRDAEAKMDHLRHKFAEQTLKLAAVDKEQQTAEALSRRSKELRSSVVGMEKHLSHLRAQVELSTAEIEELAVVDKSKCVPTEPFLRFISALSSILFAVQHPTDQPPPFQTTATLNARSPRGSRPSRTSTEARSRRWSSNEMVWHGRSPSFAKRAIFLPKRPPRSTSRTRPSPTRTRRRRASSIRHARPRFIVEQLGTYFATTRIRVTSTPEASPASPSSATRGLRPPSRTTSRRPTASPRPTPNRARSPRSLDGAKEARADTP